MPSALGLWAYISGKSLMPILQLLHVIGFTYHKQDQRPFLLNLVFTNNPSTINYVRHCSLLGFSDHEYLMWQYKVSAMELNYKDVACRYNFWKGNYPAMSEEFDKNKLG